MIAASDSAGKASARTSTRASDKSADNSPFAMLLASTAQQPSQKQSLAPADKDDTAKPPVEAADTRSDADQTDTAPAAQKTVSSSSARDKKNDKDDSGQAEESDVPPAQTSDSTAAVLVAVIPQPTNPQTFNIALTAPDGDMEKPAPTDSGTPKIDPAGLKAGAPPVNDNAPTPTPVAVPDAGEIGNETQPPVAASLIPQISSRPDGSKPATDKPAKPVPDQPQRAENLAPAPATDATMTMQTAMAAPVPSTAAGTAADTAASDTAPAIQAVGIAAAATDKPPASDPVDKTSRPANADGKPATVPDPAPLTATASPVAVARTEMAKNNGLAKSDGDSKPIHAADAQPDVPAPPQPMPTPSLPHVVANAFGIAPPIAAANDTTVTSSVQITTANAEPTPDLDALAVSVAARAMSGAKQFEIRLDPPELGRVDVRLSIDASGKIQAHMTADHPQTLDLLQKDATNLTQALRDAGLDVSQDGLNFSLRGQDRQSDDSNNGAGPGRRTNLIASRAILAVQSPSAISFNGAAANARVDIHV